MSDGARSPERDRKEIAIYVAGFPPRVTSKEMEEYFSKVGPVGRIDIKSKFAFVYFENRRDAEKAIDRFHRRAFDGDDRHILRLEFARGDGIVSRRQERRGEVKPADTLFVVNFDASATRERDLENLFEKHGKIARIELKSSYAFVQYREIADATAALQATSGAELLGRKLVVQYAASAAAAAASAATARGRSLSPRRKESGTQDRNRERDRDRDRDRDKDRDRDRERDRDRDRERDRERDRDRDRDRDRGDRDRQREKDRERDKQKDRDTARGRQREAKPAAGSEQERSRFRRSRSRGSSRS